MRAAKLLGIDTPIVGELMTTVRDAMGPSYPELVDDFERINRIAVAEETAFNRTLAAGSKLFEDAAAGPGPPARRCWAARTRSPCTTPTASRSS